MQTALVIGASGGIGSAVQTALEARGVAVTALSRSQGQRQPRGCADVALQAQATRQGTFSTTVGEDDRGRQGAGRAVVGTTGSKNFDLTDPQSVSQHLSDIGPFDFVLVASGALEIDGVEPEKSIRRIEAKAMADQFALNAIGPALVLREAHRLLPRDRRSVFAVLSARVGSIGDNNLGGWISYRTAKAAANQVVRTSAIELARSHRQAICVALHPGTVETAFTEKYLARHPAVPPSDAADNLLRVVDGLTSKQTGGFFDWAGKEVPW